MLKEEKVRIEPKELRKQNATGENEDSKNINTPVEVLTATSIIEDEVKNFAGETLGNIRNIMINLRSGCVEYVILEYGGFLGIGEKLFAVPFKALMLDPKKQLFILDIEKEKLNEAPGFDKEQWPETNSEHWQDVDGYWDVKRHKFHKKFI